MVSHPSKEKNDYFIDPNSPAELARLMCQDRLVTKYMGGLFPERSDIPTMKSILDLACGPGGWIMDVAFAYPEAEVMGIDISERMVKYAFAQAQSQRLTNVSFEVMDATQSLAFSDNSIDLLNIRFLGFLAPGVWPSLLQECRRILKPGGVLRWTDSEWGFTNSPAFEQLQAWLNHAFKRAGGTFSPDARRLGITSAMRKLLKDAGFLNIQQKAYVIDFSTEMEDHEAFCQDFMVVFQLVQPFLLQMGVTTQEEVERVYQQLVVEIAEDNFCGIMYLLTVWGDKPI